MTRVVLDTNVLIGGMPALDADDEFAVASISYAELEAGTRLAASGEERARRVRRLALVRATYGAGLPFDDRVASSFGVLVELVRGSGRSVRSRTADLMIAATAHAYGAEVLTHNVDDFVGVEEAVHVRAAVTDRPAGA